MANLSEKLWLVENKRRGTLVMALVDKTSALNEALQ